MQKIANIVYENELINHTKVKYINYINDQISFDKIDTTLPTLYVGWKFLKLSNPNDNLILNHNILDKRIISYQLYWEFSFEENKSDHVTGVKMFVNNAPYYYFNSNYKFTNIDPVFFNICDFDDLKLLLPKTVDYYYKYKNEMLYTLSGSSIVGIDLKMYDFFNFDIEAILDEIRKRCIGGGVIDPDADDYKNYYKIFPEFEFLKRYLVVLLSKQ